jgi:hypothetical protein
MDEQKTLISFGKRTLVTLIPKHSAARAIKEYRLISCCATILKLSQRS